MELNFFKDKLFDVLNESNTLNIADIRASDLFNTFTVETADGSLFEIECRQIKN